MAEAKSVEGRPLSKREAHLEELRIKYGFAREIAKWSGRGVFVGSFALPFWAIYKGLAELAGRTTVFTFTASASILVTGAAFAALSAWWKQRSQNVELVRARERIRVLEEQLRDSQRRLLEDLSKAHDSKRR